MAATPGVVIRVIWDDATIDERAFHGRGEVRVGSGAHATVVAPGGDERYLRFRRDAGTFELTVDPGSAERLLIEGEAPVELHGLAVPLVLRIEPALAFGRVEMGSAMVEFEPVALEEEARDRGLLAWALAAMLVAIFAGGSYRIVRALSDGWRHPDDGDTALSHEDVAILRVRIGPDGTGASRPQAGSGKSLAGNAVDVPGVLKARPVSADPVSATSDEVVAFDASAPRVKKGHKKHRRKPPLEAPPRRLIEVDTDTQLPPEVPEPREQVIEGAQAALLEADLRTAVDGFSRAEEQGELSYDEQALLGLAHYLRMSLDEAQQALEKARAMEPRRPASLINLAHVAKRRGDTALEIQLLEKALALEPADCKALNGLALAQARGGHTDSAEATRIRALAACGEKYAYATINHAGMLALAGNRAGAMAELSTGLAGVDTLIPLKEYEVYADLTIDPAFSSLRGDPKFKQLLEKYLPRAVKLAAQQPAGQAGRPVPNPPPAPPQIDPLTLVE